MRNADRLGETQLAIAALAQSPVGDAVFGVNGLAATPSSTAMAQYIATVTPATSVGKATLERIGDTVAKSL